MPVFHELKFKLPPWVRQGCTFTWHTEICWSVTKMNCWWPASISRRGDNIRTISLITECWQRSCRVSFWIYQREKVTRSVQSLQHAVVGRFWGSIFSSYTLLKKVMEFNQAALSTFHIVPTKHTVIFGWWIETSDRLSSTPTIICYRILISISSKKLDPTLLQLRPDKTASPLSRSITPPTHDNQEGSSEDTPQSSTAS